MQKPDEHKIDELKEELYSRNYEQEIVSPRSNFQDTRPAVDPAWKHEEPQPLRPAPNPEGSRSFFKKLTIVAGAFFFLCAAAAVLIFYFGWNIISTNKVDIVFEGPVVIAANEKFEFDIVVQNKNNTELIEPVLYIEFPEGTKEVGDISKDLLHGKEELSAIAPGGSERRTVSAVLYGREHEVKEIKVKLEYRINGSDTAVFKKEKINDVTISSAPVTFTVNGTREVISGEEATFTVEVRSNSNEPLKNMLVKANYPFGFTFKGADPAPAFAPNIWTIPSLKPNESAVITIRGIIEGEQNDERTLHFSTGIQSAMNDKEIATLFLATRSSVLLRRPPIAVVMDIGGATSTDAVAPAGGPVTGTIRIMNNLPVQVVDAAIKATFSGEALDPLSPQAATGFYRSLDRTIIWDKSSVPSLALLNPGETVDVTFTFASSKSAATQLRSGTMSVSAVVTGKQLADEGNELLTISQSRQVKLQSVLALAPRVVYSVGPFKNSGPVPPRAEKKTTYTIVWTATNTANPVTQAQVVARLPQYVEWKNAVSPATEKITWNPETREVLWSIGDMEPRSTRTGIFQVELLPSTSQIGTVPTIVEGVVVQGIDTFTDRLMTVPIASHTTNLSTDPQFGGKEGIVTK